MNQREQNRARFPELAEIADMYGPDCRIVWAKDEAGEIGKRPTLDPHHFEISAESYERAMKNLAARGRK